MFKSGSTKLVRDLNRKHILNLVRMQPGITGRQISLDTGLQISTVLYTLRALQSEKMIYQTGMGASTIKGGKPPACWAINPEFGYVLGLEIISTELRLSILSFDTNPIYTQKKKLPDPSDDDSILTSLLEIVKHGIQSSGITLSKVLGLGLGIPGLIQHKDNLILRSPAFHQKSFNIVKILNDYYSFPVAIDNDANAGALGSKWLDPQLPMQPNILYLHIQQDFSGMGVGLIFNHEVYRGRHNFAGEIGRVFSEQIWQRILTKAGSDKSIACPICEQTDIKKGILPKLSTVVDAALRGDKSAELILCELAKEIGKHVVTLNNLLDPGVIVIGGDICEARKIIAPIIEQRLSKGAIGQHDIKLHFSPFGAYSASIGSSALIFREIYNSD